LAPNADPKVVPLDALKVVTGAEPNENFGLAAAAESPAFDVFATGATAGGAPKLNLGALAGVFDVPSVGFELLPNAEEPLPLPKSEDVGAVLEPLPNAEVVEGVPFAPKAGLAAIVLELALPKAFEVRAVPKADVVDFGASEAALFVPKRDVVLELAPPKALGAEPNVGAGLGASEVVPLVLARPPNAEFVVALELLEPNKLGVLPPPNVEAAPPPNADTAALGASGVGAVPNAGLADVPVLTVPNELGALPPPNADVPPPPNNDFGASVDAGVVGLLGVPKLNTGLLAGAGAGTGAV
jgi:hypothetical protein